jgi:hypothetical protein
MEAYFLVTEVTIIDRKKKVEKNKIDVTCWSDLPYRKYLNHKIKSETMVLQINLISSGRTKKIDSMKIVGEVMKRLEGEIK